METGDASGMNTAKPGVALRFVEKESLRYSAKVSLPIFDEIQHLVGNVGCRSVRAAHDAWIAS